VDLPPWTSQLVDLSTVAAIESLAEKPPGSSREHAREKFLGGTDFARGHLYKVALSQVPPRVAEEVVEVLDADLHRSRLSECGESVIELGGAVEPVFSEEWLDLEFDDAPEPSFVVRIGALTKVAMADSEAWTKCWIRLDALVKSRKALLDDLPQRGFDTPAGEVGSKTLAAERGLEVDEYEPTAKRIVHERERSICRVHHADHVEVRRNVKARLIVVGIGQRDSVPRISLIGFDEG
jgi:hypothetical protein